ncbi:MAG: hypothetical protein H7A36_05530 [Chlamydiales bacterium]|nr:hypothetical protein [Chlamydiales bacterium]
MRIACLLLTLLTLPLAATQKMHGPDFHTRSEPVEGPRIRVLLAKGVNSALLEVRGPYRVIRRDTQTFLSGGLVGKRYVVHGLQDGLRWGEEFPAVKNFTIIPTSRETQFFVNGFQYRGAITVCRDSNGQLVFVNEASIEDFVKSVLAVKYQTPMSREAAAALAIVERTKAYSRVVANQEAHLLWDVTAQESGYCGYGVTHQRNGVDEAVEWTPFMVMQSKKGVESLVDLRLSSSKAAELANMGCDARRILSECFPATRLGLTADPEKFAVR